MTLLAFDYQGVFESRDGQIEMELFDFIKTPPENTVIAIISMLPRASLQAQLQTHDVDLSHIHLYGYDNMKHKADAITQLQKTFSPTTTLFVTDTVRDIQDVSRTTAKIYAVAWGFGHQEHLQEALSHDKVASDPKTLISDIQSFL